MGSDELKEVKIALNKVQRRKPRASNSKGQPLLLQGDVLDVPITSSATPLKECIEENKYHVPVTLNLFEPVKLEIGRSVKVEGRELYQTGSSTQGRLRTALSEVCVDIRLMFTRSCCIHYCSISFCSRCYLGGKNISYIRSTYEFSTD